MNEHLLRWLHMPLRWQWITVLAGPLLLLSITAWSGLRPLRVNCLALAVQQQQLSMRLQSRMDHLRTQPGWAGQQIKNHQLRELLHAGDEQFFSLEALLVYAGGLLERWQPHSQGGELVLLLSWPQLQLAFNYLTALSQPISLKSFVIQRGGDRLRVAMTLGWQDEE